MCKSCQQFTAEEAYKGVLAMDILVIKSAKVSEVAQVARGEIRLRSFLNKKWKQITKKAVTRAVKEIKRENPTGAYIALIIKEELDKWPESVKEVFEKEIGNAYKLGRSAGYKRAKGQKVRTGYGNKELKYIQKSDDSDVEFTEKDEEVIAALLGHQLFWIDDFIDVAFAVAIADIVREVMAEVGEGTVEASVILAERLNEAFGTIRTPDGFVGPMDQYLDNLAANTMTIALAYGVLRSFSETGVVHYQITNPSDHRTCERCNWLVGKVFTVEQGISQMEETLSATGKEELKAAHPWLSLKQIQEVSKSPGRIPGRAGRTDSNSLAEAGVSIPPFHYKCRCGVEVA